MPIKQTYAQHGDACATAHALELIGDRWTYPVLRELMLGPKRFSELASAVRGVTPAVLTTRLREMERSGLVVKAQLPPPAGVGVYEATPWARELVPAFDLLGRWAQASPLRSLEGCGLTPDGVAQSMRTMAPAHPLDPPVALELRLRDVRVPNGHAYRFAATWGERFDIRRIDDAAVLAATATVSGDSSTWAGVLYEGAPLSEVEVAGSRADVERLVAAFAAPTDDVVAVARRGEAPIAQIAKDFGISESCLRNWMAKDDIGAGIRPGTTAAENAELKDARRRIRLLEQENEVLRRAAAYLSQANLKLGQSPK